MQAIRTLSDTGAWRARGRTDYVEGGSLPAGSAEPFTRHMVVATPPDGNPIPPDAYIWRVVAGGVELVQSTVENTPPPAEWGLSGRTIRMLDDQAGAPFVFGAAFDSTGDELDEIISAGLRMAMARWNERATAQLTWDKALDRYPAQATVQSGTGSAGTVPLGDAPVTSTQNVTVFLDDFTRTSAELVGTMPNTGGAWQGTSGQYEVANDRVQAKLTGATPATAAASRTKPMWAPVTNSLRDGCDGAWRMLVRVSTATDGRSLGTDVYGPVTASGDAIWIQADYSDAAPSVTVRLRVSGIQRTVMTLPASALAAGTADQSKLFSLVISGSSVTANVGGSSMSDNLSPAEIAALGKYDRVQFATNDPRFVLDQVFAPARRTTTSPAPTQTIVPGSGLQALIYNGAIAGSTLQDQLDRFDRMYPLPMNAFIIGGSLNYANRTAADLIAEYEALIARARVKSPNVLPIIVMQNPLYPDPTRPASRISDHQARVRALGVWAAANGYMLVNTFDAFLAQTDGGSSYVDELGAHPNSLGRALQAQVLRDALWAVSRRGQTGGGSGLAGGATVSFTVPATMDGIDVVLAYRAVRGGVETGETQVTVKALPHSFFGLFDGEWHPISSPFDIADTEAEIGWSYPGPETYPGNSLYPGSIPYPSLALYPDNFYPA
jgi:hypothetical protein